MMRVNLQQFGGGKSGRGGGGSPGATKHDGGILLPMKKEKKDSVFEKLMQLPERKNDDIPRVYKPRKEKASSKGERVSRVSPKEEYELYVSRNGKETFEKDITGEEILEKMQFSKFSELWSNKKNGSVRYVVRKKKK